MQSIAILGAGIQGISCALALVHKGYRVTLIDQASGSMQRASYVNEGKIHLGFVYAKDPDFRTPQLMLAGAMRFSPLLEEWFGEKIEWKSLTSTPFTYGVMADSMLSIDTLLERYSRLQSCWEDLAQQGHYEYLGEKPQALWQDSPDPRHYKHPWAQKFDGETVVNWVDTVEASVDLGRLRTLLRTKIDAHPQIELCFNRYIEAVERTPNGFSVIHRAHDGNPDAQTQRSQFDRVVNCLWEGRLKVDSTMDLRPRRAWNYRLKYRLLGTLPPQLADLPSMTFVLGSYGDIVTGLADNTTYLSWYPACMQGWNTEETPPLQWQNAAEGCDSPEVKQRIAQETIDAFDKLVPGMAQFQVKDVAGGIIFAWGKHDIDVPESELH